MTAVTARFTKGRSGRPVWRGFVATLGAELRAFYREPQALMFTLVQPFLLLLVLDSFNFKTVLPTGEERPYLDRLLPGMMAFSGMTVGLNSVAFVLSRYKARGVLRRVRTTPVPTGSFIAGIIVSRLVVALAVLFVTYASGVFVFGAELEGNVLSLMVLTLLGAVVFIALGVLMVSLARSEDDIPPMFIIILMPSMLFSGAFLDRGGLPDWLHALTNLLPLTYLVDAVQTIANAGGGLGDVGGDIAGLAVWGLLASGLSAWRFRMA